MNKHACNTHPRHFESTSISINSMKIRCDCGHIISDGTDHIPYKCKLLPDDGVWENVHEPIVQGLLDFTRSIASSDREGWISRHFGKGYPSDIDNESLVSDFIAARMLRGPTAYQCTECGMVLIPKRNGDGYAGFSPVDQADVWRDIFSWRE